MPDGSPRIIYFPAGVSGGCPSGEAFGVPLAHVGFRPALFGVPALSISFLHVGKRNFVYLQRGGYSPDRWPYIQADIQNEAARAKDLARGSNGRGDHPIFAIREIYRG